MKIRNGFVSNSSSSSFVCVVKANAFNDAVKTQSPLFQAVLNNVMYKSKVLGMDCMVFATMSGMGGETSWEYMELEPIRKEALELAKSQSIELDSEDVSDCNIRELIYDVQSFLRKIPKDERWMCDQGL